MSIDENLRRFSIKIESTERNPNTGGGYTYLESFKNFFDENKWIVHHSSANSRGKINLLYRLINRVLILWNDSKYDFIFFKSNYIPRFTFNKNAVLVVDFPFVSNLKSLDRFKIQKVKYIICNSDYTARYVMLYWNRDAQILYPPCMDFSKIKTVKKKQILSVGRFTNSTRSKRQNALIEAFKRLVDNGISEYQLILVGYVEDRTYLDELKQQCQGYAVQFHENIDVQEMKKLYAESTFYWHACGFQINVNLYPALTEHYGIAVVDGMAAGCICIVHNSGGPAELLRNFKYKLVWDSIHELVLITQELVLNRELSFRISEMLKSQSLKYSQNEFNKRLCNLLTE